MGLKYDPNYTFEEWAQKVQDYELKKSIKMLENGTDKNLVLDQISQNITKKLLHFILIKFKESNILSSYDEEESRKKYFETMRNIGPTADHMNDADDVS